MLGTFGYALFGVLALAVIYVCISLMLPQYKRSVTEAKRHKNGQRMIEAAKLNIRRFVHNTRGDMIAVCTTQAFNEALMEHGRKIDRGEANEWDKVVCYARPLFTFAGSKQTRRPVHTGCKSDLFSMVEVLIKGLCGLGKDDVSGRDFNKAAEIIFERDERLYVPYATGLSKEGEEQFKFFGKTTLEEAIKTLKL